MFGAFLYVQNNLFCFLIKFRRVPHATPRSSTMNSFVLSSVHDTRNIFPLIFSNAYMRCIMFLFMVQFSHPYVAVGNVTCYVLLAIVSTCLSFVCISLPASV